MNDVLRLWCVAAANEDPNTRADREFLELVQSLAARAELVARFADSPEFVRSFALDSSPGAWAATPRDGLDALHARGSSDSSRREVLWLASPLRIAEFVASTLALAEHDSARLEPRPYTLTVIDHTAARGPQRRPSLVGFELDWLPLELSGSGGFPGATPRK
ncbi:MAG: hypothetical protein L6Q99_07565 [Planctomycetes bacterium]|nr:hypothetical protein [Planctomycetota bacterium]